MLEFHIHRPNQEPWNCGQRTRHYPHPINQFRSCAGVPAGSYDMALSREELDNRFGTHKATIEGPEATLPKHKNLRLSYRTLAGHLNEVLPDGREKALAMTALEEASMWSHKSIAQTAPLEGEG